MCPIPGSSSQSADDGPDRVWVLVAVIVGVIVIAAVGYLMLRPTQSVPVTIAHAISDDAGGICDRVVTQRFPARDPDGSGFQKNAGSSYLINCDPNGPIAQIIEYPSAGAMATALKRRGRSAVYRGQQVCVLEKTLIFGSFAHKDTLAKECAKLDGKIEGPVAAASS